MAHLKKGATGHLYKTAAGHLMNDCGGVGGENTCNECDPAIPDTLYVTLDGLGGSFAGWDDKHTLTWNGGGDPTWCIWEMWVDNNYVSLTYEINIWQIYLKAASNCNKQWRGQSEQACTPAGTYAEHDCNDSGCSGSCAASSGATCVVSTS